MSTLKFTVSDTLSCPKSGEPMDLRHHEAQVQFVRYGVYVTVESWWWQCPCGFVLPAQRTAGDG